ncbi:hypothetical protein [Thermogymnomonas acidicola]|uniref:hypothetical protein n=1 Tax=Thermogymnomonas acidicola TaxID=399579 RepID=UPI0014940269|nr:hypothetical protein [Thermogymnomonas acidicola]
MALKTMYISRSLEVTPPRYAFSILGMMSALTLSSTSLPYLGCGSLGYRNS